MSGNIISKIELERICRIYSDSILFSNPFALLVALSGCETSFGTDIVARFEYGYSKNSLAYRRSTLLQEGYKLHGDFCAMSYGPWQILWIVAVENGYKMDLEPGDLRSGDASGPFVVKVLNKILQKGASTVEQIGIAYNGGFGALKDPNPGHLKYAKRLRQYYDQCVAKF